MNENIKEMKQRHKKELEELQANCKHEKISECMPIYIAHSDYGPCIKMCEFCGKITHTTENIKVCIAWKDNKPDRRCIKHPEGTHFECPERRCGFIIKERLL